MEILKGFEFQLQRFAGDSIKIAIAESDDHSKKELAETSLTLPEATEAGTYYIDSNAALGTADYGLVITQADAPAGEGVRIATLVVNADGSAEITFTNGHDGAKTLSLPTLSTLTSITVTGYTDEVFTFEDYGDAKSLTLNSNGAVTDATGLVLSGVSVNFDTDDEIDVTDKADSHLKITGTMTVETLVDDVEAVKDMTNGSSISGLPYDLTVTVDLYFDNGDSIKVNGQTYVQSGNNDQINVTATENSSRLTGGSVKIDASEGSKSTSVSLKNDDDTYTVAVTNGSAVVSYEGEISGLDVNDSVKVSLGDDSESLTYTVIDSKTLSVDDGKGKVNFYSVTGSLTTATIDAKTSGFETTDIKNAGDVTVVQDGEIKVADVTTTKYFTAIGQGSSTETDNTAVTVEGDKTPKIVTVDKEATNGINLTGTTAKVTDNGTETVYKLSSNASAKAKSASFTSTYGVISDAKGTIALQTGATALDVRGTVNVDASSAATTLTKLTYKAGDNAAVNGAKITIKEAL